MLITLSSFSRLGNGGAGALAVLVGSIGAVQAEPTRGLPREGAYEVEVRIEIPHVDSRKFVATNRICVVQAGDPPLPVLSANNPFTGCLARNVEHRGADLRYDIVCRGRDAAKAQASYTLTPDAFAGRIAMRLGGKNMTMVELQRGRRLGGCELAAAPAG